MGQLPVSHPNHRPVRVHAQQSIMRACPEIPIAGSKKENDSRPGSALARSGKACYLTVLPPTPIAKTRGEPDPPIGILAHSRDFLGRKLVRRSRPDTTPVLQRHQAGTAAHPKPARTIHAQVVYGLEPALERLQQPDLAFAELIQISDLDPGPDASFPVRKQGSDEAVAQSFLAPEPFPYLSLEPDQSSQGAHPECSLGIRGDTRDKHPCGHRSVSLGERHRTQPAVILPGQAG